MAQKLSTNIINDFVKAVTVDKDADSKTPATLRGTCRIVNGAMYAQIDNSDILTPVKTTCAAKDGDRVEIRLYNHEATITGNLTDKAVGEETSKSIVDKALNGFVITNSNFIDGTIDGSIFQDGTIVGSKIDASTFADGQISGAAIDTSNFKDGTISGSTIDTSTFKDGQIRGSVIDTSTFQNGSIKGTVIDASTFTDGQISGSKIEDSSISGSKIEDSTISGSKIENSTIESSHLTQATFDDIKGQTIEAVKGDIDQLTAGKADIEDLEAVEAKISTLDTDYAKIDFANINKASIEALYAKQGMLDNVIMRESTVTGVLVAVSLKGDVIEANTLKADRILLRGEDGLYYNLNVDALGIASAEQLTEDEQVQLQNGIHGEVIIAESITANKISVDDLVAFGATIGGFEIDTDKITSIGMSDFESDNGIWIESTGFFSVGGETDYIRFDPVTHKLTIKSSELMLASGSSLSEQFEAIQSQIAQNADRIELVFNDTTVTDNDIGLLRSYFRFDENDLEIGKAGNDVVTKIGNESFMIVENQVPVTAITNKSMYIGNASIMDNLRFNNFLWLRRSNGHMSLKFSDVLDSEDEMLEIFGQTIRGGES